MSKEMLEDFNRFTGREAMRDTDELVRNKNGSNQELISPDYSN